MADWDENSERLRQNLEQVLSEIQRCSRGERSRPSFEDARQWHLGIMNGLVAKKPEYVGRFRGEPGLERLGVRVGASLGVTAGEVHACLVRFEEELQQRLAVWDGVVPVGGRPNAEQLNGVLELCAWAHSEWVRIHPFANGNGRTARLWANRLALRYGLPPFIRLRPRPNHGYDSAGEASMKGEWQKTTEVFRQLLIQFIEEQIDLSKIK